VLRCVYFLCQEQQFVVNQSRWSSLSQFRMVWSYAASIVDQSYDWMHQKLEKCRFWNDFLLRSMCSAHLSVLWSILSLLGRTYHSNHSVLLQCSWNHSSVLHDQNCCSGCSVQNREAVYFSAAQVRFGCIECCPLDLFKDRDLAYVINSFVFPMRQTTQFDEPRWALAWFFSRPWLSL
jgi:hypothetical protein